MKGKIYEKCAALLLGLMLVFPALGYAEIVDEDPSALAMTGDLIIARPLLLVLTAVGTVTYVVALPFTLLGGNAKQAGNTLVVEPAMSTFVRCLGCTRSGYRQTFNDSSSEMDSGTGY